MLKFCSQCITLFNVFAVVKPSRAGRKPTRCLSCCQKTTSDEFGKWLEHWRNKNLEEYRAKQKAGHAHWNRRNRGKLVIYAFRHDKRRRLREPAWAKDDPRVLALYETASKRGMHVDHVLPLCGKFVSGLHVFENLQLLTPEENRAKGNSYVPQ